MIFHGTSSHCSFGRISYDEDDTSDDDSSKKPKIKAETSSGNSYLVAQVTSSNLNRDTLCLKKGFARSNNLNERCCEIDLKNLQGKTWTLGLRYSRTNDRAYIRGGWRSFCFENGLEVESFHRFKLVGNGTRPLLQLCSNFIQEGNNSKTKRRRIDCSENASMKQNKFLKITFKPYMLTSGQLQLPRAFVRDNEIKEAEEITLVDKDGVKWSSYVACVIANEQERFYMAKGWRSFCAANRLKSGVSFTLEFVRGENTTPMLRLCSMAKVKVSKNEETVQESRIEEETRFKKRARGRVIEEGGPSCCIRASSKSRSDAKNVCSKQPLQPNSISDHITKVKQSIMDTLTCVRRFESVLEIKEQNLEASLQNINALGMI